MKSNQKRIALIVAVLAVAVVAVLALTRTTKPSDNPSRTVDRSNQAAVATQRVSIKGMQFIPSDITVKKGSTVTWVNQDTTAHSLVGDDGINNPQFALNETATHTFTTAGTFSYHCGVHPSMGGTVTVTE